MLRAVIHVLFLFSVAVSAEATDSFRPEGLSVAEWNSVLEQIPEADKRRIVSVVLNPERDSGCQSRAAEVDATDAEELLESLVGIGSCGLEVSVEREKRKVGIARHVFSFEKRNDIWVLWNEGAWSQGSS